MKYISKKLAELFSKGNRNPETKEQKAEYKNAIKELKSYTDRDLQDIGINRSEIETVVRHGFATNDSMNDQNTAA